jgi:hypothetical protein
MIPKYDDFRILFEGAQLEYLDLYKKEIEEIMMSDIDDKDDKDDSLDDFDELYSIEETGAEALFELLFSIPMILDDDYVEVINILADEYLPYDVDACYEDDELVVYVDDDRHVIDSKDGCAIVRKFDEIIGPDFETRVMKMSIDEDNFFSLLILKSEDWTYLENKYGTKIAEYFEKMDKVNFIIK